MIIHTSIKTRGQGLHEITEAIQKVLAQSQQSDGVCTLFVQHTSASLLIQENADPSARLDLENWFNRLVSEDDPLYTHTLEGPDDMPSHIKSAMGSTSLTIPFEHSKLSLGTWQGVFLWEHRKTGSVRRLVIHLCE